MGAFAVSAMAMGAAAIAKEYGSRHLFGISRQRVARRERQKSKD